MKDNEIMVNGEKLSVLFTFNYNKKSYVVYKTNNNEISASIYNYDGINLELLPIETDEEWNMVDEKLKGMNN